MCFLSNVFKELPHIHPFESCESSWRTQTVPKEAYYGAYVYNIGDDRVHDMSEMFRELKSAKRIDKETIAPDQLYVGYDKIYK